MENPKEIKPWWDDDQTEEELKKNHPTAWVIIQLCAVIVAIIVFTIIKSFFE